MKYRLIEGKRVIAIFNEDSTEIANEIVKDVKKMSFYRRNNEPVIVLGGWPGIALWKIKVLFTTDVEKDFNYKTQPVTD